MNHDGMSQFTFFYRDRATGQFRRLNGDGLRMPENTAPEHALWEMLRRFYSESVPVADEWAVMVDGATIEHFHVTREVSVDFKLRRAAL